MDMVENFWTYSKLKNGTQVNDKPTFGASALLDTLVQNEKQWLRFCLPAFYTHA